MPSFTITLTDDEHDDVSETVGDADKWLKANVANLVAQCRSACRQKRAREVGIDVDLTLRGLTEEEVLRIIGPREDALEAKRHEERVAKARKEIGGELPDLPPLPADDEDVVSPS